LASEIKAAIFAGNNRYDNNRLSFLTKETFFILKANQAYNLLFQGISGDFADYSSF